MVDVECENDLQEDLYHYTDFAVLKSIYEKGEIWASNSQYLNDISEMQLGPKAIKLALLRRTKEAAEPLLPLLDSAGSRARSLREFSANQTADAEGRI